MRERLKAKADLSSSAEGKCEVKLINTFIGRGVFVKEDIQKNQFLMEYKGQLLQTDKDGGDDETFKFYFRHINREWCIDASKTQCTAAMVNDIDKETNANCKMVKRTDNDGQPKLCLFAITYNNSGSELRYDYGVTNAPWRKQKKNNSRPVFYPEPFNSNVAENLFEEPCQDEEALGEFCPSQSSLPGLDGVIRLPPMGLVYVEKQPVAWEDCCVEYWCEKPRKCMSRRTGRRDITEKLLKMALNPNQSINS